MFKNLNIINHMEWKLTIHMKAGTNIDNFPRYFEIEGPLGMQTVQVTYIVCEE